MGTQQSGLDIPMLGIDIGSVSISLALVGADGTILRGAYRFHQGKLKETLSSMVAETVPPGLIRAVTTASGRGLIPSLAAFDFQVCLISAAQRLFPRAGSILFVGGEKFGLIRLDGDGKYLGTRMNSSCAAGTGSFLDQQARRLGLSGIGELANEALASSSEAPKISTRCAVFAKTDLVHAQAAGYSLGEICDGLCRGLAQNIADTLLAGQAPNPPVIFAGGVSRNEAVRRQLERLFTVPVISYEHSPILGAYGACLRALEHSSGIVPLDLRRALGDGLLIAGGKKKEYFNAPLPWKVDASRGAAADARAEFSDGRFSRAHPVEVEVYGGMEPGARTDVFMGIDIGATSTKAILIGVDRRPLVGLYTRTSGAPMSAVQALCEALDGLLENRQAGIRFLGVGATGAGRKFIGKIVGADMIVDEITAHAKAAYALDPEIDTIIEIGGQDAKFTTMKNGMVTFSHMNTICAAGTGSFLEEQAARLGCRLDLYADRVRGAAAPLASDRCAVFMERDINNYLSQGYSTEEILAAALFSVRENYLQKVARGASMGAKICFQGATARNGALVAAFEQGLGKPIFVSPYCHLTGALGAALLTEETGRTGTGFRGLDALLEEEIPIRGETCGLCANHCRIRLAVIGGETVAYGFLCGRDYDTTRYVSNNTSGFDLSAEWKKAWPDGPRARVEKGVLPLIGIPAALTMCETLPFWKKFFSLLSIPYITSEKVQQGVLLGKEVAGAEFCAPLTALHGHVRWLLENADYIFLPLYMEERESGRSRSYCYYTQFSAALASTIAGEHSRRRFLMPMAGSDRGRNGVKGELYHALFQAGFNSLSPLSVSRAFDRAARFQRSGREALRRRFTQEMAGIVSPAVVLIGRPYTALSPELNKGIPQIFASLGVKVFYQDMVPCPRSIVQEIQPLLRNLPWKYAARALATAAVAAETPLLYPVFITAFRCSPDSFALEYFKRILDSRGKPYLILQLDDHDSSVGYETRIEAGVTSFRNHAATRGKTALPLRPISTGYSQVDPGKGRKGLNGKTLFFPNWDPLVVPLLAANLRHEGIDALPLDENEIRIRKAMRHNTGQCIPLNIIAEDFIEQVETQGLDPAKTALWIPDARLACNITMFPSFMKSTLETYGGGFEKADVYSGDISQIEIGVRASINAYRAHLLGGLLRRTGCRLRPYEKERGSTDRAIELAMAVLIEAFEGKTALEAAVVKAASLFDGLAGEDGRRPQAALFGDLYARDNDVLNQDLIHAIETAGGEVVTTPYTDYVHIVADAYFRKWFRAGEYLRVAKMRVLYAAMKLLASGTYRPFERFLGRRQTAPRRDSDEILSPFGLRSEHAGESYDNLLKIFHIIGEHPDLRLFVQVSPAFCCPALVTEAMSRDIQRVTGIPVVSLTYDGTGQYKNDAVVPYLSFPPGREHSRRSDRVAWGGPAPIGR
jgi:predicted CoA-substrate-specific enzyme activase